MANYWGVICNEPNAPGVWQKWLVANCVAIGWPPPTYQLEGPSNTPGWDSARAFAQQVSPGDIVIPYLLRWRFGIPGEVVKVAIADNEWNPTLGKGEYADNPDEPELGRRIQVKWLTNGVPQQDKIALVPLNDRISGGMIKKTIVPLRNNYAKFMAIIQSPANWQPYVPTAPEPSDDEQPEP